MKIAILHYSVAPVVGGVEEVIQFHTRLLLEAGHEVTLFGGRGSKEALPAGADFQLLPEMDTRHPLVARLALELEQGRVPPEFEQAVSGLEKRLGPLLSPFDRVIAHNIFSAYLNLPLTAALCRLLEKHRLRGCIAWCHDLTWTSTHSGSRVHPGYPWDILRTYLPDVTYVTVSRSRQKDLAGLMDVLPEKIHLVYNGADPRTLLGLSSEGIGLARRMDLFESDLILILPVRATRAKNIEYALRVTAGLKQRGWKPRLVVTGPPDPHDPSIMDYYHGLQALCRQLDIEKEARFVYDSGPQIGQPFIVDASLVAELYRLSDVLLMPSHYEGFGMPVLEAGLVGLPVFCTGFPSAEEIGREDVHIFSESDPPEKVAGLIEAWARGSPIHRFRMQVRRCYTWQAVFDRDILPLLNGDTQAYVPGRGRT